MGSAASDILLSPRGVPQQPTRLGAGDLQVSWEFGQPGALSCRVPLADLRAAGLTGNLIGWWVRYEHPKCGAWGGVLDQIAYGDGVAEFAASSFVTLARGRLVTLKGAYDEVGAILRRCLALADQQAPATGLVVSPSNFAPSPMRVGTDFDQSDLLDEVVPLLTDDADCWWTVDADRVVRFGPKPTLATAAESAVLNGQVEIAQARWADDLTSVFNDITVTGQGFLTKTKKGSGKSTTSLRDLVPERRQDQSSIDRFGRLQEQVDYSPISTQGDLKAYASRQIALLAEPAAAVTLTVTDTGAAWDVVREGAVVGLRLGLEGISGRMLVESRALDAAAGTLTVSGSAVRTG